MVKHELAISSSKKAPPTPPRRGSALLRRWEMECTSRTDADGRLIQRASYSDVDRDGTGAGGCTFDPKDVFQGQGGGIGGRGGGRGDGTTPADPADSTADPARGEKVREFGLVKLCVGCV